jgi:class 3 adenylate cyclase
MGLGAARAEKLLADGDRRATMTGERKHSHGTGRAAHNGPHMGDPSDGVPEAGERAAAGESPRPASAVPRQPASPTRGFLFADLRDYTRFVETRGATAAADLLLRYRSIVRNAVGRYDGSEIKTEGDSFYVVFLAVSDAVQCGLAIAADARASAGGPEAPISVGIGIHAGETVDTPDGFVGGAVNIAARVCALARPGEVLVTDTVRALTQSVLPVSFQPRGRRRLKGVAESISIYSVTESRVPLRRSRRVLAAAVALVALGALAALAAALFVFRPAGALPPGPWTVGVQVPLGEQAFRGQPQLNGVQLAVDEINAAGGVDGAQLVLDVRDESDPQKAATDAQAFVDDSRMVADVGPSGSNNAKTIIPITNRAGLFECSPREHQSRPDQAGVRRFEAARRPPRPDQLRSPRDQRQHPGSRRSVLRLPHSRCTSCSRHR